MSMLMSHKAVSVAILNFKVTLRILANLNMNKMDDDAIQPQRVKPIELDAKNAGQPGKTGETGAKNMHQALQRSS